MGDYDSFSSPVQQNDPYAAFSSPAKAAQKTGPQPTATQTLIASPLGSFMHDAVLPVAKSVAGAGADIMNTMLNPVAALTAPSVSTMLNKTADAAIQKPYEAALAAQQNRPGYAAERAKADAMQAADGNGGLSDQIQAPFGRTVAGLAGLVGSGGNFNAMTANSDAQAASQSAYQSKHPILSPIAQLAGGLMAKPVGNTPLPAPDTETAPGLTSQIAGVRSGVGGRPLSEAYKSGRAGGPQAEAFQENLRGNVDPVDILDQAKQALGSLKSDRNSAYRSGMVDLGKDQTVLSFDPIDEALQKTSGVANFKGQDLAPKTAQARSDVAAILDNWKSLPAAEYHTPEGFDALKQQIGDLRDSYPYGDRSRIVVDNAYNAVKEAIKKQAPAYAETMKAYQTASDEIDNIQRTLSLNPKASVDTAMRKLQSVMRDGVNTNFGARAKLAETLSNSGDKTLMPALAGQSLNSWMPRGLMRAVAGAEGAAALPLMMHDPKAAAALLATAPLSSPRLLGEGAYYAGKLSAPISKGLTYAAGATPAATSAAAIPYGLLSSMPLLLQPQRQ